MTVDGDVVVLDVAGVGDRARCPSCGATSSRVHGRYRRRPLDLPWRGHTVRLVATVRRFRCDDRGCRILTFAEGLARLPVRARRTDDATAVLLWVVSVAGGEKGARLAAALGLPVSADTLLRLQRRSGAEPPPTPRVLGVDDLALRRGHDYATLLVDLEMGCPVDLLKGREASALATWLRDHPGVEVVVRDRAGPYAEGARVGAPSAIQVADRFHLVRSATTALEEMLRAHRRTIAAARIALAPPPDGVVAPAAPERPLSATARYQTERRAARVARWEMVRALRADGMGVMRIAQEMGMHRRTVRALLASPVPPRNRVLHPRPPPLASPTLAPYVPYLQDRWQAGARNVSQLVREIVALGYPGSVSLVRQALHAWRPPRPRRHLRPPAERLPRRFNARRLCLRPVDRLDGDELAALEQLLADHPDLAAGHALVERFRHLVADRDIAGLDPWLADARASGLATFQSLANGLAGDRAAVAAALTTPWSTGPVEGHVHRVKLIKRAGYGRAKLDLLRTRILAAA